MKKRIFKGCGTALVTPMKDDYSVDYDALKVLVERQINAGVDALIVCATTGEAPTLKIDEHLKVIEKVIEYADGRAKIVAGTGSNDTLHSVETSKSAKELGADGILSVTPYYNKPTGAGLITHFTYIADRVDLPLIVYNVPSRTGVSISPEVYLELSKHPNIVATKEASGNLALAAKIRALCGDELDIYSGNDDVTVPLLSLGGIGTISVLSNVVPSDVCEMCRAYFDGDVARAAELQIKYMGLIDALFCETNPIMAKEALAMMGLIECGMRMPLVRASAEHKNHLENELKMLGLI